MRGHAVALGQQLEEVEEPLVGALDDLADPVLLLLRREVRREQEHLEVTVLVELVGELPKLLAHVVGHVVLRRDLEQRVRVDLGQLFHQPLPFSPDRAEKSTSCSASSTSRFWSSLVERLAHHLLGGGDRQVGHLAADLAERAPRLLLDVAAASAPSSPRAAAWPRSSTPRRTAPRTGGRDGRCRPPARAPHAAARGTPGAAGRPPRACASRRRSTPRPCSRASRAPPGSADRPRA